MRVSDEEDWQKTDERKREVKNIITELEGRGKQSACSTSSEVLHFGI